MIEGAEGKEVDMIVPCGEIPEELAGAFIGGGQRRLIEVPVLRHLELGLRDLIGSREIDIKNVLVVEARGPDGEGLPLRGEREQNGEDKRGEQEPVDTGRHEFQNLMM
jgi:hypothetical protein